MMTKRFTKLIVAVFLIFLSGCEDNLSELVIEEEQLLEQNQLVASPDLLRGSITDFPGLSELLKTEVDDKKIRLQKSVDAELFNFEVIQNAVSQISWEEDFHYTFPLVRENEAEETYENLVITNREGYDPEAFIVEYFPDDAYWESLAINPNAPVTGTARITPMDISAISLSASGCGRTETITTTYCVYDGHEDNDRGPDVAGPACEETVPQTAVA